MKYEIVQKFRGTIGENVTVDDESVFWSVLYLAELTESKFGVALPDKFVEELVFATASAKAKTEYFSFTEFEEQYSHSLDSESEDLLLGGDWEYQFKEATDMLTKIIKGEQV